MRHRYIFDLARSCALLGFAITVAACASKIAGEDYQRPQSPTKSGWSQLDGRQIAVSEVIRPDWWTQFGDQYLDGLIDQAVDDSLDLRLASLRLEAAGIDLKDRRRGQFPTINLNPTQKVGGGKGRSTTDSDNIDLSVSWELDIWGKIRKGVNAERAAYRTTEMNWRGAYLKLISDVASRYFAIRLLDEQVEFQKGSLANSEQLLQIFEQQYGEGMVARTRLLNQKSEISSLRQQLLEQQRARDTSELQLATLLGIPAGQFAVPQNPLPDSIELIDIPEVLPGDLLAQRPDVLAAEFEVLRTHQLLGKARLARLPTLNLAANFNLKSFVESNWLWGLTSSFAGMFDRNVGVQIDKSEIALKVSTEEYRKSVLTAFEEVEVALLNMRSRKEQMMLLQEQIEALTTVQNVNRARMKVGLISQLELFETERTLLSAQQQLLSSRSQLLTDTIVLYIALGGGWPAETVSVSSVAKVK